MSYSGLAASPSAKVTPNLIAHKLVFLGSLAEGLAPQSHQELTVGCGEGFLGKVKNNHDESFLPLLCVSSSIGPPLDYTQDLFPSFGESASWRTHRSISAGQPERSMRSVE